MTDKPKKRNKLSYEILGMFAFCLVISILLYIFMLYFGYAIIDEYTYSQSESIENELIYHLENTVFSVSILVAVGFFAILFISLFGQKISYIFAITRGVDALQRGEYGKKVELKWNNELTQLAEAVNYLSESERIVKEKEKKLNDEREVLIRTLSHDIRTPLTSIISYTDLFSLKENCTQAEQREYLSLVKKKSAQIKELTEILLDGGQRQVEKIENARLLMEQLTGEFEEILEDDFKLTIDLQALPLFEGSFDIRELRRIFDNLISNIQKYADPNMTVELSISKFGDDIVIRQSNVIKINSETTESYHMGINSIKRIVHNYGGSVEICKNATTFEIIIKLSDF